VLPPIAVESSVSLPLVDNRNPPISASVVKTGEPCQPGRRRLRRRAHLWRHSCGRGDEAAGGTFPAAIISVFCAKTLEQKSRHEGISERHPMLMVALAIAAGIVAAGLCVYMVGPAILATYGN